MNSKAKQAKNELQRIVADYKKSVDKAYKDFKGCFEDSLSELFAKHSEKPYNVQSISSYINNHEFNDGDATYFSFGYDDLNICINGKEFLSYDDENDSVVKAIFDEFRELFRLFDEGDFYEKIMGDLHENVCIRVSKGKLIIE